MSTSSYNESLAILLESISVQFNRYVSIFILLFGIVGNSLNILVLMQRKLRSNSCAWLFMVASIVNIFSIVFGLITRMMSDWITDPTAYIGWLCKLRAHLVFSTRTMALWLIALATIDRWLLSSIHADYRKKSNLKNAQRCTCIIITFSILLYAQVFYCYEANLIDASIPCYGKTVTCLHLNHLSFALITILMPIFLMIMFGLSTISNVHQSQHRIKFLQLGSVKLDTAKVSKSKHEIHERKSKQKIDHSLIRMLLVQVILLIIFTLPLAIQNLYVSISGENMSSRERIIANFVYELTVLIYFLSNGVPFYIYTLCGGTVFRKTLYEILIMLKRKLICK